jgi:CotH kinase protein/Lamin Tail Domain/Fn3 associated/Secretion system C-terminal sorting domain/Divergent InlB B-repeat domain
MLYIKSKYYFYLILTFTMILPFSAKSQDLFINELMSSNSITIPDEDGDYSDWIELYNGSGSTLNLNGYFLSDDPEQPDKWSFANTSIGPSEFLLIFASDKDRNSWPDELHANFKLNANGETLILSDPDTIEIDYIEFPPTTEDISIGRVGDGVDEWALFEIPTPLATNNTSPTPILQASPPLSSLQSGSYPAGTTLELSSIEGEIYYTTNGSLPDGNSIEYETGILLNSVTVIRAICLVPNKRASEIVNATYIVDFESDLAIVSLITDPPNLWDWETGLYVLGPNANPSPPNYGANFWESWEKPVHLDFFNENGNRGWSQNLGMRIHGGYSRSFPLKSLRFYARSEYGESTINDNIFPDKSIFEYKRFILRNSGSDWIFTFFRDALVANLLQPTSLCSQAYRPSVVFINGDYWGIQNLRERIDKYYIESNFGIDPESLELIYVEGHSAIEGSVDFYQSMVDYALDNDITQQAVFDSVSNMMNIENFIQYYSSEIFIGNTDWPAHNNECWRSTDPVTKFEWIVYDIDYGLGLAEDYTYNTLAFASSDTSITWGNDPQATRLFRRLLYNAEFVDNFIVRSCDMTNIIFEKSMTLNKINMFKSRIEPEINRHCERWYPENDWEASIDVVRDFIRNRKQYMIQHLRDKFSLGDDFELIVNNVDSTLGKVMVNAFWLETDNFSGTYFEGSPIRLIAEPSTGYRFVGWSGDIESVNDTLEFTFDSETNIQPNFALIPENLPIVIINEINYNSCESFDPDDWIELYALGGDVNLSGWSLSDGDDTVEYTFPAGVIIEQDSFLVVAKNPDQFSLAFVSLPTPIGGFDFGLSSNGDQVILKDQESNVIDFVEYQTTNPWPTQPNGNGPTLELSDTALPNQYPHNWSASLVLYGTPNFSSSFAVEEPPDVPLEFSINKIYPNPFNSSTRIEIFLAQRRNITISVYNILGQQIKIIHSGFILSGTYNFNFHGEDLPSGIYFVRANIPDILDQIEKITLLK